jgi:hypothetical protein
VADTRVLITAEADQAIAEFNRLRAEGSASLNQLASQGNRTLGTIGQSAAQHANAMRMIPAQVTDMVVSLQSGQAPLTVFLQQGGQLRDMFGSSGAAARALGTYVVGLVNPFTVAAAAGLALAVAYKQGSQEADGYRKSIEMTGGVVGATVDQMAGMSREIGKVVGTQAAASEAVAALGGTGQLAVENLKEFSQVAIEQERAIGKSVADTATDFAELGKAPLRASEKLTEQYHYLTAAVYQQIKALEDQGKLDEAGAVAQKAYADAMGERSARIVANLGTMEKAWTSVKDFAKGAWDAMLDVGRSDTIEEKIAKAEATLAKAKANRYTFMGSGAEGKAALDNAQKRVNALKEERDAAAWNAKVKADGVKLEEATIAWMKEGDQYLSKRARMEKEIVAVREKGLAAGVADAEINERIGQVRKKYSELNNSGIAALEAQRGLEQEKVSGALSALESQRRQRLVSEQAYITARRDLQLRDLDAERALVQKQADLAAGKADLAERQKYLGALAVLQERRKNIIRQADDAQAELATAASQALAAQGAAWERATAGEQAALQGEIALFGKSAEARKIVAAQVQVDTEARKLLDNWQERGHAASEAERAELERLAAARKANIGAIMGEQQARAGAEQLRAENLKSAAMADPDQKGRALAVLEQEADIWRERIRLAGEGTAAQKLLQTEFNTWYANQKRKVLIDVDLAGATELLKIVEAVDEATKSAAAGMAASFGRVGSAIGSLTTALSGYSRTQASIAAQLALATKNAGGDTTKIAKANAAAAQQSAQAQIKSYGDMAGAAKGFFKENTAGYRALEGAEKAYRAVEMAMALQSMATKLFTVNSVTAATVAGEATKATAVASGTATQLAADATKGASAAALAVATQAQGDPYTAWGRMAAMAAAMAALGFAVSGGGHKDTTAADRQKAAGTGSVLGDSAAKSDSIARSVELAASNSSIELSHTAGMLASLRNIESSIAGLGNLLVRDSGLTGALAPNSKGSAASFTEGGGAKLTLTSILDSVSNGWFGKISGKISNAVFGGNVSTLDTGLTVNRTSLSAALSGGLAASQYTDTKKDGGWFHSDKENTSLSSLGAQANDQITKVIAGLAGGVAEAGKLLGVGGDEFVAHLNTFVVDIGKVSLKGLTGEQIQKQLETVFAKVGDDLARYGVGGLEQFQKVGEGYMETLTRVATNYANLDSILASIGTTFGATGIQSLAAREHLIEMNGGISELASRTNSFAENFLTEAERLAPVQKYVAEQLAALGMAGVNTRDAFKAATLEIVNSGALATEEGAKRYASLMNIQEAFAKLHPVIEDTANAAKSLADIQSERNAIEKQIREIAMSDAEKARAAIDASNLARYDELQLLLAAKDERQRQLDAEAEARQRVAQVESSLQDQINGLLKARMNEAQLRSLETAGMAASTVALYDRLAALKADEAARTKLAADASAYGAARAGLMDEIFNASLGGMDLQGKVDALKSAEAGLWAKVGSGQDSIDALNKIKTLAMQRIELEDQLQAKSVTDVQAQYQVRKDTLTRELEAMVKMRDVAGQMRDFAAGLKFGDLSALAPVDQLASVRNQYNETLRRARGGDESAIGNLQSLAQSFLGIEKQYFGSTASYAATFASVVGDLEQFGASAPNDQQIANQKLQIATIESTSAALGTAVRDASAKQVDVLQRIDAAMRKAQESAEAQLKVSQAANLELIKQLKESNAKISEIESRLARVELA